MTIIEKITNTYPELANVPFITVGIQVNDDSDGLGQYIAKWEYSKPIPEGLTLGKPGGN